MQALRGVGGIILNSEGLRFCNELGRGGSQTVGPLLGLAPVKSGGGRDETSDLPVFFLVGFKRKNSPRFWLLEVF